MFQKYRHPRRYFWINIQNNLYRNSWTNFWWNSWVNFWSNPSILCEISGTGMNLVEFLTKSLEDESLKQSLMKMSERFFERLPVRIPGGILYNFLKEFLKKIPFGISNRISGMKSAYWVFFFERLLKNGNIIIGNIDYILIFRKSGFQYF